jgi:hypothetical protein
VLEFKKKTQLGAKSSLPKNVFELIFAMEASNHAQSGSVTGCGERAGVAMSQNGDVVAEKIDDRGSAEIADSLVRFDVERHFGFEFRKKIFASKGV